MLTVAVMVMGPRARTGVVWLTELAFIEYDAILIFKPKERAGKRKNLP
jgi:hypothetical protein